MIQDKELNQALWIDTKNKSAKQSKMFINRYRLIVYDVGVMLHAAGLDMTPLQMITHLLPSTWWVGPHTQ